MIGQFGFQSDNYNRSWLISFVFCNTSTTIISGAMAERTFNDTYVFSTLMQAALVYPIAAGWVWGGGWLSVIGFKDFAGSGVVHLVGGASGCVAAFLLGPRLGFFKDQKLDRFKFGRSDI